jgi:hypothetical protein
VAGGSGRGDEVPSAADRYIRSVDKIVSEQPSRHEMNGRLARIVIATALALVVLAAEAAVVVAARDSGYVSRPRATAAVTDCKPVHHAARHCV